MNNIQKMPDAYYKVADGNLYNLLQLASMLDTTITTDINDIGNSRDIHNAIGATLDNYGAMVGVERNGATDTQYITKILNKIGVNTSGSDTNSVIKAVAQTLSAETSDISITEGDLSVKVNGLTVAMLESSGYSASETTELIKQLIPIGVALETTVYAGTLLLFADHYTFILGMDQTIFDNYPFLWTAWFKGQEQLLDGKEVGLSGEGTVPSTWKVTTDPATDAHYRLSEMQTTGTYNGGTLSILI